MPVSDETTSASPAKEETPSVSAEEGITTVKKAQKTKKQASDGASTSSEDNDVPVGPFADIIFAIQEDLPDYKTLVVDGNLMIGIEPQIAVDCKVTNNKGIGPVVANYYGFINKEKREQIQKVLSKLGVLNGSAPFLHRNGR